MRRRSRYVAEAVREKLSSRDLDLVRACERANQTADWRALERGSEIRKTRPCMVLTTNLDNQHRCTVVVVPLSSSP